MRWPPLPPRTPWACARRRWRRGSVPWRPAAGGSAPTPASVEAALRNLMALRRERRCIVVLADMLELGEASGSSHFRIGHMLGGIKPDLLFTHGTEAAAIAGGAREGGLDPGRVTHVGEGE